jgi:hypothetical protein
MIHQFFSGLQAVTGSGPGPGSTMGVVVHSTIIPDFDLDWYRVPVAHKTNANAYERIGEPILLCLID